MASSLFAGCGMISQAVSNVKYGGRGRLSTLFSCSFLLVPMVAHPRLSNTVMLATVASHNLAPGVLVGVLFSGVFFTAKVTRLMHVTPEGDAATGPLVYRITGQVFFASADAFAEVFDLDAAGKAGLRVDVSQAHFWDVTAVAALDKIIGRYRANGISVEVVGMNEATATIVERLAVHDKERPEPST